MSKAKHTKLPWTMIKESHFEDTDIVIVGADGKEELCRSMPACYPSGRKDGKFVIYKEKTDE
jgi:hypothetical protein